MGKIVVLDELTINKIAAGEVIERPASVVKELVENSIDAGANKITVEIQNGGISKIRIIDNGCGISKDDMEFAFERHATSKIRQADDLENIKSMGFRGEALASIASISNVEMISKTDEYNIGNKIVVEGGKIIENEEAAAQNGTTITVSNLFFNTPVRYKFLKKDFTEAGYIEDAVTRIALSHPEIAIKLINGSKTVIQTTGSGKLEDVIYSIYGKDIAENIVNVDYNYEDINISGVVGKPEIARNNRSHQLFFVNKRYIKDKTLSAASEQALKGLIMIGKYPFLVLNLEMEPKNVDVNVHPSKLEVRWQEEQKVFKGLYHAIRESMLKDGYVKVEEEKENAVKPIVEQINQTEIHIDPEPVEDIAKTQTLRVPSFINIFKKKNEEEVEPFIEAHKENTIQDIFNKNNNITMDENHEDDENNVENIIDNNIENETKNDTESDGFKLPTEEQVDKINQILKMQREMENNESKEPVKHDFSEMYEKTFGKTPEKGKIEEKETVYNADLESVENISVFEDNESYNIIPNYKYKGNLFSTYIIIEIKDDIYIIDQHAAHERVMYEKVKKNFYDEKEKESQIMLLPDIINLTHKEKNIVKENSDLFEKAGFTFEEFGDNTIRLIGVPSLCMDLDTKELFLEILDEIDTVAITAKQEKEDRFISTIACKAAVKGNMKLNEKEVENLMQELLVLPNPFTCPHGRPIAIKMTKYELDKKFGRT